MVILGYAIFAGISSASRSVLLISMFSVGYFAILDSQKVRLVIVSVLGGVGFVLTSGSREYTFISNVFVFGDAFELALSIVLSGQISIFDLISGIANRFFGAQDMILAYQFVREETWLAMVSYFMSGGRADSIVPDLGRDLFDMDLEGTGFGVGIGIMAYALILTHSNILVMPFFVLALGFLISAGNKLLIYALGKAVGARLVSQFIASGPLKIMLGGFMALSLYSSSIVLFYKLCQLILMTLFIHFLLVRSKTTVNQNAKQLKKAI